MKSPANHSRTLPLLAYMDGTTLPLCVWHSVLSVDRKFPVIVLLNQLYLNKSFQFPSTPDRQLRPSFLNPREITMFHPFIYRSFRVLKLIIVRLYFSLVIITKSSQYLFFFHSPNVVFVKLPYRFRLNFHLIVSDTT